MDKQRVLSLVRLLAAYSEFEWSIPQEDMIAFDPVLAELYGRYKADVEALGSYCKGRLEGK